MLEILTNNELNSVNVDIDTNNNTSMHTLANVGSIDDGGSNQDNNNNNSNHNSSVIDNLLNDIYDKWHYKSRNDSSWDSDTMTSASDGTIVAQAISTCNSRSSTTFSWNKLLGICVIQSDGEQTPWIPLTESALSSRNFDELHSIRDQLKQMISVFNSILVRQLKRRDHSFIRMQKNCDILTAILQASSLKRREDTKLKFVMEPKPGNEAFKQWCDAMRGVVRLPLGLPPEIRKRVWLSLANHHISVQKYDWNRVIKFAFNERSNPDDDALGLQIVKDLHRTGCDTFTTESERAVLKRVLLAYARWNKRVGYCQGFNVLAAIILEVMQRNEENSLKVMVYLVDHILPESYFAQNLQALSIDMAVFRELLNTHVPKLANHLNYLQTKSQKQNCYGNSQHYEPPLTNVFTMQWFLTLFATCLPPCLVLRIWDSIMLEGSEIILRTGLVIWESLSERLLKVKDADSFYCRMRELTTELFDGNIVQSEQLVHRVYTIAPIPFPFLTSLRDRFTYNINPFSSIPSAVVSYGAGDNDVGEDDEDEDLKQKSSRKSGMGCFAGMVPNSGVSNHTKEGDEGQLCHSLSTIDISQVGPGAVSSHRIHNRSKDDNNTRNNSFNSNLNDYSSPELNGATKERMSTDLPALETQYRRIKHKQKATSLCISSVGVIQHSNPSQLHKPIDREEIVSSPSHSVNIAYPTAQNSMVNHLFLPPKTVIVPTVVRPNLSRQQRLKSSISDNNSIFSSVAQQPASVDNQYQQSRYDDKQVKKRVSSTVSSSIRPRSDSSTISQIYTNNNNTKTKTKYYKCGKGGKGGMINQSKKLSLSQSDITSTINDDDIDDEGGVDGDDPNSEFDLYDEIVTGRSRKARSASLSDLSDRQPPTLLQLCNIAHVNDMINNKLEETEKTISLTTQPLPAPDLNSILERHHKRIQNGTVVPRLARTPTATTDNGKTTYLPHHRASIPGAMLSQTLNKPIKVLPNEDNPNEIGNTARWVAEHHLQSLYLPDYSASSNNTHTLHSSKEIQKQSSLTSINYSGRPYKSIFGSKNGLYQTLAHSRAAKCKGNGLLRSVYTSIDETTSSPTIEPVLPAATASNGS